MMALLDLRGDSQRPRQAHPAQDAHRPPRRIELAFAQAEARRSRVRVVVVVQAFSGGHPSNPAQIRRGVVEIARADGVIRPVDDGAENDVRPRLNHIGNPAPERAKQRHENCDAKNHSEQTEPEEIPVEPTVADVRSKPRDRLRVVGLAPVVIEVAEQNLPQPFQHRAVRVAIHVGMAMVFAVHGHPFFRVDAGEKPEL